MTERIPERFDPAQRGLRATEVDAVTGIDNDTIAVLHRLSGIHFASNATADMLARNRMVLPSAIKAGQRLAQVAEEAFYTLRDALESYRAALPVQAPAGVQRCTLCTQPVHLDERSGLLRASRDVFAPGDSCQGRHHETQEV